MSAGGREPNGGRIVLLFAVLAVALVSADMAFAANPFGVARPEPVVTVTSLLASAS